jgi:hypothetical protein
MIFILLIINRMNNIIKKLHRPLDNTNGSNACWFNSSLYLVSSHPYIFFQYLLLSNNKITNDDIDRKLYFEYILYNYKYVRSVANDKSPIIYNEKFHINYHNFIFKHKLIEPYIAYGEQYDAQNTLLYLVTALTNGNSYGNNKLSYLIYRSTYLRNTNDINNKLTYIDTVNNIETTYTLFGFVRSELCVPVTRQTLDFSAFHWTTYIRLTFDKNNDKWYHFDALDGNEKKRFINTKDIYQCQTPGEEHQIVCLYIDMKKFNNIFSNKKILEIYNNFVETIKPESYTDIKFKDNKKKIESLELELKNLLNTINIDDINLLTIQELEIIFEKQINKDKDYVKKIDKRAFFNTLI